MPDGLTDLISPGRTMALGDTCTELPVSNVSSGAALHWIEQSSTSATTKSAKQLRVAFWNAERGQTPEAAADLLSEAGIDLALLCELDNGVLRSHQRHATRDIAQGLNANYLYAVEFIEMETRDADIRGFHGNAIMSPQAMSDPLLVRFPEDSAWVSGVGRARRLGGRIALATRIMLDGTSIVVATTHLESHAGPDLRASQMQALVDALDTYADGRPVLIGGDFNTRTTSKDAMRRTGSRLALQREDCEIFTQPYHREPLFDVAARAGFDWVSCNQPRPTERAKPELPDQPLFRLDWFFSRGLVCEQPDILLAETRTGKPLSDHNAITVNIRLPETC